VIRNERIYLEVTSAKINPGRMYDFVVCEHAGAVDLFIGTVRDTFNGRAVKSIEYHSYPEMTERVLESIAEQAIAHWPIEKIAVQHRIGHLGLAEASVIIAVSSVHRSEAFSACRFIIEEIKAHAPIWKKEFFADGTKEWKDSGSKIS